MAERFVFSAPVVYWRGPAPHVFARLPHSVGEAVAGLSKLASYGWGCIPVTATIEGVRFTTSLFPKDGTYLLPLKVAVRRRLKIAEGGELEVTMEIGAAR